MSKTKSAWARDAEEGCQFRAGRYWRAVRRATTVQSDGILVSGIEADEEAAGGIIQDMIRLEVLGGGHH